MLGLLVRSLSWVFAACRTNYLGMNTTDILLIVLCVPGALQVLFSLSIVGALLFILYGDRKPAPTVELAAARVVRRAP